MNDIEEICVGAKLVCDDCGKSVLMDPAKVGLYVRFGWPVCCGETMRLVLKTEQDDAQGGLTHDN